MNTKGIKFLAVLAVFAMAFAVVATVNDSQSDAAGNIIGVYDENGQLISDTTVSSNMTWYVDAEASITGAAINVEAGGTLTIVLKDSETPSVFTIYGATIAGNMVLSKNITMILPSTGTSIAVTGALTVNGTVQNDKENTAFTLSGASAKIDGTGTIQGTVAPMLSIVSGMVTGVTFSAAKWDPTKAYAGFEMVEVASSNDDNVTIDGVSFEMVAGTVADNEYAHGICVDKIAEGKTVLIKNVTFASAKSENVKTQYLIGATNVSGILKMEKINCDSVVFADDGAMFNAMGLTKIGEDVTWDDTLKSVKLSNACTITKSVKIDNLVLRTKGGSLSVAEGQTLTVNGGITYAGENQATITLGNNSKIVNSGTTRMDGNIKITGGNVVNNGTLVMDNKATIENLTNTKTVRLYDGVIGTAGTTAAGTLVNNGTIYVMDEAAVINVATKSGTGTIDTSAISEEVFIHGDISTSETEFKWNQKVTFDGDTTLLKGASLTFYGKVIIPAGVTVTIEDGAAIIINGDKAKALGQLNIDGTLIIEGFIPVSNNNATAVAGLTIVKGEVVNNGTIELAYDGSEAKAELVNIGAGTTFANNGIITIGEKSQLVNAAASFVNKADGVITVFGDLKETDQATNAIINSGLITLSSEVNSAITISNAAVGAEIDILMTAANVTIDDKKIEPIDGKLVPGENQIALTVKTGTTCGGITVTGALYPVLDAETSKIVSHTALVIDGALIVSKETEEVTAADNATLALTSTADGRIVVADELTLTNTKLTTETNTTLYVSGELTLTKDCEFANNGVLTVPGIVYMIGCSINPAGTINAAMYKVPQTVLTSQVTVYTNVPDAIAGAEEASVKTVTVTGTVTIAESIIIPAGMTVKVSGTTSTVTIAKDVVVEVYSDGIEFAVLNNEGTIKVNGKLIYDDAKKSQKGTEPVSEVVLKSDNTVVYTTLAWAIADAGSEEATITLCGPTTITKDMTIPENITVDTDSMNFTVKDAVLTIDGFLFLNGTTEYTVDGDAEIIVNGAIISEKDMPYDGKKFPAGLYFSVGDNKLHYIGNIDDAEAWALLADEGKLTYEGDLKTIGISFDADATLDFNGNVTAVSMTVGSNAIVNFKKKVEIATVTMGEATISFAQGKTIDGIFTSPVGTIAFDEALVNAASSLKVAVKSTVTTMTLSGDVGKAETKDDYEYQISTLGDVVITAKLADLYVGAGTTTIGKSTSIDYILVDGDLVIDNTFTLTAIDVYVYGSVTANDATDTLKKGVAVFDFISVGIDYDDDYATGSAAVVYGDVTADYAFVSADATVSDTITDMPYSTDIYVEGVEELTIYSTDSKYNYKAELDMIDFVISDPSAADTIEWLDEDGVEVKSFVVGAYDAIYAVFDYNIYDILIVTDAGIKSVAINGIQMLASGSNSFIMVDLATGTYKVTYTLKTGYSGEAVLSTSTGTILKDNSFVISPGSETALTFQLAGTEPTPEPEPVTPEEKSEWTVTTILLVILVILIAIMAVIVALRLNRS